MSKASIRRLRQGWNEEFEAWSGRPLGDRKVVYLWADGVYVKAGLEKDKAAPLVVMGALSDGTKELLAVVPGYRESTESWGAVFRDLKARGIQAPKLILADGLAGIWAAAREVWPESKEQRCWNHKMRNVLDRLPRREQVTGRDLLRKIVYAPSREEAVAARRAFEKRFDSATTLIWKLLTVAEKRFRKLNAPHLLQQVAEGHIFKDGKPVHTTPGRVAA